MMTENQRREARIDVRVPIVVYRGKTAVPTETVDVSYKGLFVRADDPPALRSLVRLKVWLADREFEAHAMAVHVVAASDDPSDRVAGVGLQFWGLAGPNRAAWDDFVRTLVGARRAAIAAAAKKNVNGLPSSPPGPVADLAPVSQTTPVVHTTDLATPSGVHVVGPLGPRAAVPSRK